MWVGVGSVLWFLLILIPPRGILGESFNYFENLKKYQSNPILYSSGTQAEAKAVFNPSVILENGTFYMFYRAENWGMENWPDPFHRPPFWNEDMEFPGVSTICLATSVDGITFQKYENNPLLFPTLPHLENIGGLEDPRISKVDDTFYLTYTCVGGLDRYSKLCLATSYDLLNWKKHGTIFGELLVKSGGILNGRINGKMYMFFGDKNIGLAISHNGLDWEIIENDLMKPRKGFFDEKLVEVGPSPILVSEGILLVYNGATFGASTRTGHYFWPNEDRYRTYSTGYSIFSKEDPSKLLYRTEYAILNVTEDFEKRGQVDNVVFSEGLVRNGSKFYLYYGCSDTFISVAIEEP